MAPAKTNVDFEETSAILGDLQNVFFSAEDAEVAKYIRKLYSELLNDFKARQDGYQNLIREVSRKAEAAERSVPPPSLAEELDARLRDDARTRRAALEHVAAAERGITELEEQRRALCDDESALARKREEIEAVAVGSVPATRHLLSLYAHISHIMWRASLQQDVIAGTITKYDDIQEFKLNKREKNAFEISNALWDMMDT